jgi:DNA-binding response OmpR family regulator
VRIARNGTEALEFLKAEKPDIILLDIMMPDVDGYEIGKFIKSDKHLKDIHIVFMSAKTKDEDVQKGMDIGASLYVKKPFSTRELLKDLELLTIDR